MRSRLLAAFLGLVVSLLLAEVVVRWFAPGEMFDGLSCIEPSARTGWTLRPDCRDEVANPPEFRTRVVVGPRGTRGDDPGDRSALVGLGDSFMFGWGVEEDETFLALTASRLGLAPLNGGVPSFDPCQAAARGPELAATGRPAAILLSIFLGNDESDLEHALAGPRRPEGVESKPSWRHEPARAMRRLLFTHSSLVRLVRYSPLVTRVEAWWNGRPDPYEATLGEIVALHSTTTSPATRAADDQLDRCLGDLARFADAHRIPLAVVLLPDLDDVDSAQLEADARRVGVPMSDLDAGAVRRRLLPLLARLGLHVIDLTPAFTVGIARGEPLFYRVDRHFTAAGHRLAADVLAQALGSWAATPDDSPTTHPR